MLHSVHSPAQKKSERKPVLVLLHGRGADEHDLFGIKEMFPPEYEITSLRAPFEFDWGGFTWFEMFENGSVNETSFQQSRAEAMDSLSLLKKENLILLGFSMGAIMSYALALTAPKLCKGIACLSGFAPKELQSRYKLRELQELRIFISHGINDPVIPIDMARETKEMLSHSNGIVSYHEYAMGHEINAECMKDVRLWLEQFV